jgi:hypothetical protein
VAIYKAGQRRSHRQKPNLTANNTDNTDLHGSKKFT